MPPTYNSDRQPALEEVNRYIKRLLSNHIPAIQALWPLLHAHKGKQLRPQLALGVATLLNGPLLTERTCRAAAFIALLHHASLIHDDVIDQATYRRHVATLNQNLGNKGAVLGGDYLLAVIFQTAARHQDYDYITLLCTTVQKMIEGECIQSAYRATAPCQTTYFTIIQKKTASLFGAACSIGALAASAPTKQIKDFHKIGEAFGLAFQLYDDLLDYTPSAISGKAPLMDIKNKLFTLPLLYAFERSNPSEKEGVEAILRDDTAPDASSVLSFLLQFIKKKGGMAYTYEKLSQHRYKAIQLLYRTTSDHPARESLVALFEQSIPNKDGLEKLDIL